MTSLLRNSSIKRVEKEILKESKVEEGTVKQILKDLSRLEKDVRNAQKAAANADTTVSKREQYEHKTAKAMNNAIHEHDLAEVKLRAAGKDAKLKHKHHAKLVKELEAKKAAVESALNGQAVHDQERQSKLARMRGVTLPWEEPISPQQINSPPVANQTVLPGQSGPAVQNNGYAPGYGVDYNHTAIDSEGNPQGDQRHQFDDGRDNDLPGHLRV